MFNFYYYKFIIELSILKLLLISSTSLFINKINNNKIIVIIVIRILEIFVMMNQSLITTDVYNIVLFQIISLVLKNTFIIKKIIDILIDKLLLSINHEC